MGALAAVAASLRLPEPVYEVKSVENRRRNRDGPEQAPPTLLEALEHDHLVGEVHAVGSELKRPR